MDRDKMRDQVQRRRSEQTDQADRLELKPRHGEYSVLGTRWIEITGMSDCQRRFFDPIVDVEGRIELQNSRRGPRWVVVPVEKS